MNFCTLFNSNYLSRGLALQHSLQLLNCDYHLYILAMNDACYEVLSNLKLDNCTLISLKEFENNDLINIKQSRTQAEYCWTCTPAILKFCFEHYNLNHCIYIDADMYFYDNPITILNELTHDKHVIITPHHYTQGYDNTLLSGIYCVQFMYFDAHTSAINILNTWYNQCIEWCFARYENGKFGDQKYLDNWAIDYPEVHVMNTRAAGIAIWNVQQYRFNIDNNKIQFVHLPSNEQGNVIFYHYHVLKFYTNNQINITGGYALSANANKHLYENYIVKLNAMKQVVLLIDKSLNPNGETPKNNTITLEKIVGKMKATYIKIKLWLN